MFDSFFGIAWENVAIGLLGGFIVSGFFLASRRVNEWLLQRKYPVSGEYISKFEDIADGQKVTATAPATLRQRGRRVEGSTTMNGRVWEISGDLTRNGYIHGIYAALDPLDQGVGNFFLRVGQGRRLDGLWSGYDSVNDTITSGRYMFFPVDPTIQVRPYRAQDKLALLKIADEELGRGYFDDAIVTNPEASADRFIRVAESNGRVVGFAYCQVQDWAGAEGAIRVSAPRHLRHAEAVGCLKTVAVQRDQQGRGIGTALSRACLDEFQNRGVQALYSVAWQNRDRINMAGILERAGFTRFAQVAEYWSEESVRENYTCPACGAPPCECPAVLYSTVLG
ncbi:MAG: GNAT family N-acetyltransferase [Bifidobacteriaceae bacterium]|nr:GNAT family N-acetyltransferase [Bifidobacteriaceae bacterium]